MRLGPLLPGIPHDPFEPSSYSMENGEDCLARVFESVDEHRFADSTTWPSAPALVDDYVTIGRYRSSVEDESIDLDRWRSLVEEVRRIATEVVARDEVLCSPAPLGAFVASVAGALYTSGESSAQGVHRHDHRLRSSQASLRSSRNRIT
jgi:hypothetical protein